MKKIHILLACVLSFGFAKTKAQSPPYSGTIFVNPDIITSDDPSTLESTTYIGRGEREVYDRRVKKRIKVQAYLFKIVWNDDLQAEVVVNPEFGSVAAATVEAEKYAYLIGQLPHCLRTEVKKIAIHKGKELFGGGIDGLLIHTAQADEYEADGILEETLAHEATHASLQAQGELADWIAAQKKDKRFISTYAAERPQAEDVAESFLMWLAVRYKSDKIPSDDFEIITKTIPHRLTYFDQQDFDMYPLEMP